MGRWARAEIFELQSSGSDSSQFIERELLNEHPLVGKGARMQKGAVVRVSGRSVGLKLNTYRSFVLGIIVLFGALPVRGESHGRDRDLAAIQAALQTAFPAMEASQTVLMWFPDTAVPLNTKAGIAVAVLLPLTLFFAMGYTWQALMKKNFPAPCRPAGLAAAFAAAGRTFLPGEADFSTSPLRFLFAM